jgi:hypothetical protein
MGRLDIPMERLNNVLPGDIAASGSCSVRVFSFSEMND